MQKKYEKGVVIVEAMRKLEILVIELPKYPKPAAGETLKEGDIFFWKQEVMEKKKAIVQANNNKKRAYVLVLGQ